MNIKRVDHYNSGNVRLKDGDKMVMALAEVPYFGLVDNQVVAYASLCIVDASQLTDVQNALNAVVAETRTFRTLNEARTAYPQLRRFRTLSLVTLLRDYEREDVKGDVLTLRHEGTFSAAVRSQFPNGFTATEFQTWWATQTASGQRTLTCHLQRKVKTAYGFSQFLDYDFE